MSNKISLDRAIAILNRADALYILNEAVVFGRIDDDMEEFFEGSWSDDDYRDFEVRLLKADNPEVVVQGEEMIFMERGAGGELEAVNIKPLFGTDLQVWIRDELAPREISHPEQMMEKWLWIIDYHRAKGLDPQDPKSWGAAESAWRGEAQVR